MQIHELQRETKLIKKARVGRGGKRGTTSGRGTKGQKARAGHKIRPEIRDQIKKLPKLRGYRFQSFAVKAVPVNLAALDKVFDGGALISPATLAEKKIISKKSGSLPEVKILATGSVTKKFSVVGCAVSASAKEKIEKAGGSIK